ncbi:MAG: hypothetical protein HC915_08160 [Anaerolineae bacterium]|nr:hypothetical protein [Anaerolineae bacterium]
MDGPGRLTPALRAGFLRSGGLPDNLLELLLHSRSIRHQQQGTLVLVTTDRYLRFVGQVLSQQVGLNIEFCQDVAGAWGFFNEMGYC